MAYRNYNRGRRAGTRSGGGSRWMDLRFAGPCKVCGNEIAAGARGFWDAAAKTVTCERIECAKADGLTERVWVGSPVSGSWVDQLRAARIGSPAPVAAADPFAKTRSRGYYGIDARRCEDAPCCGCCG